VESQGKPITIFIDGRPIQTVDGRIVLDLCREHNVPIPTLCHHESLSPTGACRLCVVEARFKNWSKIVVSCLYPVWEGVEIHTNSPRVLAVRRLVLDLLLSRCPEVPVVRKLAAGYGIEAPSHPKETHDCILCGMCVKACDEIVGVHALSMQGRGADKSVDTPYREASDACIACGSCVYVCPTQCIKMEDRDGVRRIWHRDFPLRYCKECGTLIGPQAQLDYFTRIAGLAPDFYDTCKGCRITAKK
jgi:NADH dehydrogenase/NADH:ubiquinone oxidoreductase subunit G